MRPALAHLLVLAAVLARPGAGAAQDRTLFLGGDLPPGVARPMRAAVGASLGAPTLDLAEARRELSALAARAEREPVDRRVARALREARDAYVELRLERAEAAYERALRVQLDAPTGADREGIARVFLERFLVYSLARRTRDARASLLTALTIAPELRPDPDTYDAAVLRRIDRARAAARRQGARVLRVERAPADAVVTVDGAVVPPGAPATVRGDGPHLVTARRFGYGPRAELVRTPAGGARVDLVLTPASGPQLAALVLGAWPAGGGAPRPDVVAAMGRALGLARVVRAERAGRGFRLVETRPGASEVLREARGGRTGWEPRPFHVLAERLAGRSPAPPGEVSLAVLAPRAVAPGAALHLEVELRDPDARVRRLEARCGPSEAAVDVPGPGRFDLALRAPTDEGRLACAVVGRSGRGRPLVRFPSGRRALHLDVTTDVAGGGVPVWIWPLLGVALAAGVGVALGVGLYEPPQVVDVVGLP